jgi:hypothetical protein
MTTVLELIANFFTDLSHWLRGKATTKRSGPIGEEDSGRLIAPWWWLAASLVMLPISWLIFR